VTGFGDHSHKRRPCHKCTVTQAELFSDRSLRNGEYISDSSSTYLYPFTPEFEARNGETHRQQCYEWKGLETDKERNNFFSQHGVRWTELARLPYFDLVRHTIIDPMHNLLLGT